MKYQDIPQYTRSSNYAVTVFWSYLEDQLNNWAESNLDLEPDFQRAHVWTLAQQSAYVEYILRGGLSGRDIYFNCVGWQAAYDGPFVIVDGKQRLAAVRGFLRDHVPVFGHRFSEIEGRLPHAARFTFHVNDLATREEVLQWYLDMNARGTPHTPEELQHVRDLLTAKR